MKIYKCDVCLKEACYLYTHPEFGDICPTCYRMVETSETALHLAAAMDRLIHDIFSTLEPGEVGKA